MNANLIAIFNSGACARCFLQWGDGRFTLESLPDFNNTDIKKFLVWLNDHDPRKQTEQEGVHYFAPVPRTDPAYRDAVLQELEIQGFAAYPVKEYQKDLLLELNDVRFIEIRKRMMGDLLTLSEEDARGFVEDLKKSLDIIAEFDRNGNGGTEL